MKKKKSFSSLIFNSCLVLVCAIVLIPFLIVLFNSMKTAPEARYLNFSLPSEYHFENYSVVVQQANLVSAAINGIIYSVSAVLIIIPLTSLTAYILVRRNDKISKVLSTYSLIGIIAPLALIPTFLVLKVTGLISSYAGLIVMYVVTNMPLAIFLFSGFINNIPRQLDESAMIDGAGLLRTFFRIIFPLLKPIISTVSIFVFMTVWNDFNIQLFFGTLELRAMPLSVYEFFGKYSQNWNLVFADIVMTIIPVLIVYLAAQKYIVSGLTAGAVKE
jgi:raffinose/stachyose/melibiose transport system permease protein